MLSYCWLCRPAGVPCPSPAPARVRIDDWWRHETGDAPWLGRLPGLGGSGGAGQVLGSGTIGMASVGMAHIFGPCRPRRRRQQPTRPPNGRFGRHTIPCVGCLDAKWRPMRSRHRRMASPTSLGRPNMAPPPGTPAARVRNIVVVHSGAEFDPSLYRRCNEIRDDGNPLPD